MTTSTVQVCSAPELVAGEPFNGGILVASRPLADRPGHYPGRIVLVDLANEYATWVAAWPADREEPKWYCTTGHYFGSRDLAKASADLDNREKRGY